MYNLIRKEVIVLRWYFLFNAGYAFVFGVILQSAFSPLMIGMLPPIMMMMFAANMELRNKAMMFVGTLPISRKQIVSAKYVTVLFYYLIGLILMAVIHTANDFAYTSANTMAMSSEITILMILLSFSFTLLYAAFYYPIQYWLGVKYSNIISLMSIFLMVIVLGTVANIIEKFSDYLIANEFVVIGIPALSLLFFYGSYRLSIIIFTRLDMTG